MPDYEEIVVQNIMTQLNEVMHIVLETKQDVAVIKSEQANIKAELAEHKAQSDKGGLEKIMSFILKWVFPIILSIFLLGRQSVEYSPKHSYTMHTDSIMRIKDDTFVESNRRFDSFLINQITKPRK